MKAVSKLKRVRFDDLWLQGMETEDVSALDGTKILCSFSLPVDHNGVALVMLLRSKREYVLRQGSQATKISFDISKKEVPMCEDLLRKIFWYSPKKRLSAAQVLEHPWFKM